MLNREGEVDIRFVYHKHRLSSIAVYFKSDVMLSSFDDAATSTGEPFCDECRHMPPGCVVVSIPTVAGDYKVAWEFGNLL